MARKCRSSRVPSAAEVALFDSVVGVGEVAAQAILAELGPDTAAHCASWAKLCPAQHASAGRRRPVRVGHGSRWLRTVLIECAHAAARSKGTYLAERYRILARRRGRQEAIVALAHEILLACHRVLATGEPYLDRGPDQARTRDEEAAKRRALKALHDLGHRVALTPLPQRTA